MTTSSSPSRRFPVGALLAAALAAAVAHAQPASAAGLHVSGTRVVESNGNNFIMRGVNHEHAWFTSRTSAFTDIKSFGSNVVRVVLSGGRWTTNTPADVANIVSICKANKVICVLEDHDTTGYGEDGAAYTLDQAVSYFATLQSVLAGQEDYIIINPGNEPIGNNNPTQWISATTSAITRLRGLGFQHLIMIDAPNWGQDWQYVMRDSAQTIWASDPNANLVFSIHMYGVFNTPASITSYLDTFRTAGLPLVIGEFGYRNNNTANVDHDTVMAEAQARGLGYIGWSWCGNNDPYLDMAVNWDKNNLSPWGQRFFNGANGIVATAREATIFGTGTSYGLTVAKAGTGTGTVTSSTGGINCGTTCTASYASGTSVTLTATAASGSGFGGWSGACTGTSSTCVVSMTAARTVTATFSVVSTSYSLTVSKNGTGSGTITSNMGAINCGSTCSATYASGTTVTLTATVASGSTFVSWSGCSSTSGATCTVSMTQNRPVTATFNTTATGNTLTVAKAGTGTGTVTSNTGGINCGTTCSATYASGTTVTLTAAAASGSTFASWSGCSSTSGATCTVSMTQARTVTATFNSTGTSYTLNVTKAGTGSGTVTSNTGGINCGSTCSATYASGTTVTLTATAASGSTFASWSGCTSSSGATCTASMTQARTATATFNTSGTGTTPCANPITFTGNTNNFNTTGPVCYRTSQTINGWGCFNMDGRTLSVNNTAMTCGQMPLPAKWSDGYTYFAATAGTYPWAGIYVW